MARFQKAAAVSLRSSGILLSFFTSTCTRLPGAADSILRITQPVRRFSRRSLGELVLAEDPVHRRAHSDSADRRAPAAPHADFDDPAFGLGRGLLEPWCGRELRSTMQPALPGGSAGCTTRRWSPRSATARRLVAAINCLRRCTGPSADGRFPNGAALRLFSNRVWLAFLGSARSAGRSSSFHDAKPALPNYCGQCS